MSVHLRQLQEKDAPGMLEWLSDPESTKYLQIDGAGATLETCREFIRLSTSDPATRHYAIASDENDEYLGTVSLKNIDFETGEAEYAIAVRSCARGTGAAANASYKVLDIAFEELGLHRVYFYVRADNSRANAFYRKVGFNLDFVERDAIDLGNCRINYNWYSVERGNE